MKPILAYVAFLFLTVSSMFGAETVIRSVSVNPTSINPTLGESVSINFTLAKPGKLTVQVVDRDGYAVRAIAHDHASAIGVNTYSWDGRDERGSVVPNEAYSFRIAWTDGNEHEIYFPADQPTSITAVTADYYAAKTASVAYSLAVPSRVHMQAGVARKNEKTGEMVGPVMKTIVNREPRTAGKIVDAWNGLDESGRINIADMRDFVLAIAATPLPENSVIAYGNNGLTFAEAALQRGGVSLFTQRPHASHAHHSGLSVLDDVSPALVIEPLNASWSQKDGAWRVAGRTLRVRVRLVGPSAHNFSLQPGELYQFADATLLKRSRRPAATPAEVEIALPKADGIRLISLNWRSDYGSVAANTIPVLADRPDGPAKEEPAR